MAQCGSVFRPTVRSVSPKCSRRSLWPSSTKIKAAIDQHRRRNLAGPCAGVVPVHVLRADLHTRVRQRRLDLARCRERRDDKGLHDAVDRRARLQQAHQRMPVPPPASCSSSSSCQSSDVVVIACTQSSVDALAGLRIEEMHSLAGKGKRLRPGPADSLARSRNRQVSSWPAKSMASSVSDPVGSTTISFAASPCRVNRMSSGRMPKTTFRPSVAVRQRARNGTTRSIWPVQGAVRCQRATCQE